MEEENVKLLLLGNEPFVGETFTKNEFVGETFTKYKFVGETFTKYIRLVSKVFNKNLNLYSLLHFL